MIVVATFGTACRALAQAAPFWLALTGIIAALAWVATRRLVGTSETRPNRVLQWLLRPFGGRRDWLWLCLACGLLLLALDGRGFTRGFPRADDFAFVQDAREMTDLRHYVALYHNDHSLPLFRLLVAAIVWSQGPSATAEQLASAFNVVNFLTYLTLLLSGSWVLRELQVRRITVILFCAVLWSWPSWGEFTAGSYTLAIYPQTIALAFLGLAALLRGTAHGQPVFLGIALVAALLAAGIDVSGVWLFPLLLLAAYLRYRTSAQKRLVFVFAATLVAASVGVLWFHFAWMPHPFSPRELVQNPAGGTVQGFTGLAAIANALWRMPLAFVAAIGGLAFSVVATPALGVLAMNTQTAWPATHGLLVLDLVFCAGVALLVPRLLARARAADGTLWLVLAFPMAATLGMTVLARHATLPATFTLWPAKYQVLPYCWAVLLVAYGVDRWLSSNPASLVVRVRGCVVISGLLLWTAVPHWEIERALALQRPWLPGGRFHNVALAEERRRDFAAFVADVQHLAATSGRRPLPWPTGYNGYASYPYLEVGHDTKFGANYLPTDLLSIAPNVGITLVPTTWTAIPKDVMTASGTAERLQPVFAVSPR